MQKSELKIRQLCWGMEQVIGAWGQESVWIVKYYYNVFFQWFDWLSCPKKRFENDYYVYSVKLILSYIVF